MSKDTWWTQRVRGIYAYGISPFYQKAFGPHFRANWRAAGRNAVAAVKLAAVPALMYIGLAMWANNWILRAHRKNPDDFAEDE